MKQLRVTVISNKRLLGELYQHRRLKYSGSRLMWLKCPELVSEVKPGQFIMVDCGEKLLLPRPFSIHQINDDAIALFYAVLADGKGTNQLSERKAGDMLDMFGPLGNGFTQQPESHKFLLVAGGMGIAPLYFMASKLIEEGHSMTLLYGTANKDRYPVPGDIGVVAATEDGSVGHRGMVTDLIPEYIDWADQVFACGPLPMYRYMAQMPELKNKPVQVSLEVRMGCGRGVCYGCTLRTKSGLKKVCEHGPVFELDDIIWDGPGT
ncbi:dihydroorotate dehydrogenase electron transfer subunit [Chloroflexota bacterium]